MIQETTSDLQKTVYSELNPDAGKESSDFSDMHADGLILDLAWILVLAAIATLLFKN